MSVIQFPGAREAVEQERAIAGMVLIAPRLWEKAKHIKPDDCTHPPVKTLFAAMHRADEKKIPFDQIALTAVVTESGDQLPQGFIDDVMGNTVVLDTIDWHVERVLDRSRTYSLRQAITAAAAKGVDPELAAESCTNAIAKYRARSAAPLGFETLRVSEVPDPGPTRWLIDGLWIAGGVGFIAGEPKTKKSLFTCAAAVAVATGRKLLNRFQAIQGPVIMFNAEDRMSETARRLRRIAISEGLGKNALDGIHLLNITGLRLNKADDMRKLMATVSRIKPAFVVLDPFRNLFDGNEDDSEAVSAALSPLRLLQREHECAVAVVHHMGKPSEIKRRAGQRMRGSGALHGWGDCNLYVELKGDVSVVEVEQRYADAHDPFGWQIRDQMTPEGEALWCEPVGIPTNDASSNGDDSRAASKASLEEQVLLLLQRSRRPMTGEEIRAALQVKRDRANLAIQALFQGDVIDHVETVIHRNDGRPRTVQAWSPKGNA